MRMSRFLSVFLLALLGGLAPAGAQQWVEHKPPGAGYRVEFPGTPEVETEDMPSEYGPMRMSTAEFIVKNEMMLMSSHTSLPAAAAGSDPKDVLDGARNGFVEQAKCKLRRESRISIDGAPARRLVMDCADGEVVGIGVLALNDNHLYSVMAAVPRGQENGANAQRFLKSFAFVPR